MTVRNSLGQFVKGAHWREPQAFRDGDWLRREYIANRRSAAEIAAQFGVTAAAVLFWLRRHGIMRRTVAAARAVKHWGPDGESNPMFGKRGAQDPNWKGGISPARQSFYSTFEWKGVARAVWERDGGDCQRCGNGPEGSRSIAIHHIVSFRVKVLRAELSNLVLLCTPCHRWVHSPRNSAGEFVQKGGAVR